MAQQTASFPESRVLHLQAHNNALKVLVSEKSKAVHRLDYEICLARNERERHEQTHEAAGALRATLKRFLFFLFLFFFVTFFPSFLVLLGLKKAPRRRS